MQVMVTLKPPGATDRAYEALFLVDTGATDSMAPGSELRASARGNSAGRVVRMTN